MNFEIISTIVRSLLFFLGDDYCYYSKVYVFETININDGYIIITTMGESLNIKVGGEDKIKYIIIKSSSSYVPKK